MKAAIIVCALVAAALAGPARMPPVSHYTRTTRLAATTSEHVRTAEAAWSAAESERDPGRQAAKWEAAAAAFAAIDGDAVDVTIKREAASVAVLAWKNALAFDIRHAALPHTIGTYAPAPHELPAREQQLIAALDRYVSYAADAADPQLPEALYLEARTYAAFDQVELATPLLRTFLERYRQHALAEYAALLLLDTYNRQGKLDLLVALADELAKDQAFMTGRDDLKATIEKIQRQARRRTAEQLEAEAKDSNEANAFAAAAAAYLAIYNADREAIDNDEVLYDAAVLFERAHATSAAIQTFGMLRTYYPRSKLAMRGLARLGRIYGDIALYDKAAETLEEYAKLYAGEKDAFDAMSDAIYFRKGIGDRAKAIEDTEYFIKTYGVKKPVDAANAMWSLVALYESDSDSLIKHLREYLHRYGGKGGAARVAIAHARIAGLLLRQSCPVRGIDGLCVEVTNRVTSNCDSRRTRTLSAVKRDPRKLRDAATELAAASTLFQRGVSDDAVARYYYAQAVLAKADLELESFFAIPFPALDSQQRFDDWRIVKELAAVKVNHGYDAVLAIKDAASSITAAERIALITQNFARGVRSHDESSTECKALADLEESLAARSLVAFGVCLAKSAELGWFSESSQLCEAELIRARPSDYPRAIELRSTPHFDAPVIAVEPPPR